MAWSKPFSVSQLAPNPWEAYRQRLEAPPTTETVPLTGAEDELTGGRVQRRLERFMVPRQGIDDVAGFQIPKVKTPIPTGANQTPIFLEKKYARNRVLMAR